MTVNSSLLVPCACAVLQCMEGEGKITVQDTHACVCPANAGATCAMCKAGCSWRPAEFYPTCPAAVSCMMHSRAGLGSHQQTTVSMYPCTTGLQVLHCTDTC